jgi:hypothetical protein
VSRFNNALQLSFDRSLQGYSEADRSCYGQHCVIGLPENFQVVLDSRIVLIAAGRARLLAKCPSADVCLHVQNELAPATWAWALDADVLEFFKGNDELFVHGYNRISIPAPLNRLDPVNVIRTKFAYGGDSGARHRTPFPAKYLILLVRMKGLEPSLPCEN